MGFSKDFLWGAATAACQIEGAFLQDGKGLSIWDVDFDGRIKHDETAHEATDHYNRWKEDVALMKEIGLKSYRFSVSWARIFPDASGAVNEKGLNFYRELVSELKAAGIEPVCTLYHWDLPLWLYERGGWLNERITDEFAKYTAVVVNALSDKVAYWITFNEPQCFIGSGYQYGGLAPFRKEPESIVKRATRIVMLAHGNAVKTIRKYAKTPPKIGFAPTAGTYVPLNESPEEIELARRATFSADYVLRAGWWADPVVGGTIPDSLKDVLTSSDIRTICQPLDFYAFNIYTAMNYDSSDKRFYKTGAPRTAMDWVIDPKCIYWAARFFYDRYRLPILVAENGMANVDFVMSDGKVHDPQRCDYIKRYLCELKRATDEGIPVIGYQYWSLMDNFEWAAGYDKRFGLIYIDYETKQRILKDSALFYREIIENNGENL